MLPLGACASNGSVQSESGVRLANWLPGLDPWRVTTYWTSQLLVPSPARWPLTGCAAFRSDSCNCSRSALRPAALAERYPVNASSRNAASAAVGEHGHSLVVQPARRPTRHRLDLPSQLVADGSRRLDLTPHAGRDLQRGRERLLQTLRRRALCQRLLGVVLEQGPLRSVFWRR